MTAARGSLPVAGVELAQRPVAGAVRAVRGRQDLGGHRRRGRAAPGAGARGCRGRPGPSRRGPRCAHGVDQRGQLDGVPGRHAAAARTATRRTAHSPASGWSQPGQLGEEQPDQRPRHQLGHPPALERHRGVVAEHRPLVEPLDQLDLRARSAAARAAPARSGCPSRARSASMKTTTSPRGHEQRLPHRLALARDGCRGRAGSRPTGAPPRRRRWPRRTSRRSESESITTISSSSATVSTSASRTRVTTSPTVAASLRAGTTRLTVVPLVSFAATRSSRVHVHHACVRRANHAGVPAPREGDSTSRGYPAAGISSGRRPGRPSPARAPRRPARW